MDQALINRIVEAALLAANQPLALAQLHALFPEDAPAPAGSVEAAPVSTCCFSAAHVEGPGIAPNTCPQTALPLSQPSPPEEANGSGDESSFFPRKIASQRTVSSNHLAAASAGAIFVHPMRSASASAPSFIKAMSSFGALDSAGFSSSAFTRAMTSRKEKGFEI